MSDWITVIVFCDKIYWHSWIRCNVAEFRYKIEYYKTGLVLFLLLLLPRLMIYSIKRIESPQLIHTPRSCHGWQGSMEHRMQSNDHVVKICLGRQSNRINYEDVSCTLHELKNSQNSYQFHTFHKLITCKSSIKSL